MAKQRIQKLLAAAGYGSRRACEQLVLDGRVAVNGERVVTLPVLVDPDADKVEVDAKPVQRDPLVYYMLNKPPGVFCTNNDPAGRTRAVDLLPPAGPRVHPVGRLDAESLGLLLLTNDGALTQKLTHPRFGVLKTYRVEVAGRPSNETIERLRGGVWLSEGRTAPAHVDVVRSNPKRTILEITLRESRNREIRRMLAKTGHNVRRMVRIKVGRLSIAKLPVGAFRKLTPDEVHYLRSLADRVPETAAQPAWRPAPRRASDKRNARRNMARQPPRIEKPGRRMLVPDSDRSQGPPKRRQGPRRRIKRW